MDLLCCCCHACAVLRSGRLLADGVRSFTERCVTGITLNHTQISHHLTHSLMLVTALNAHVGYERAAAIAKDAHKRGVSLREAARTAGIADADFDTYVQPEKMISPYTL